LPPTNTAVSTKAYAKIAGGAIAKTADDEGEITTITSPQEKARRFALPEPYNAAARLAMNKPASEISWKQLGEIASVKTDLIAADELTLPALVTYLDKKERLYSYDLLSKSADVGIAVPGVGQPARGVVEAHHRRIEVRRLIAARQPSACVLAHAPRHNRGEGVDPTAVR